MRAGIKRAISYRQLVKSALSKRLVFGFTTCPAALIVVILFVVLFPATSNAGSNQWTTGGPFGGTVTAAVFSPNLANDKTLFAASNGLYKSVDSGASFSRQETSPSNENTFQHLAISPDYEHDGTIFAAAKDGDVYRSAEAGNNLRRLENFPYSSIAPSIAVSPAYANDHTIFATVNQINSRSIYKSTDGGDTWNKVANTTSFLDQIVVSPAFQGDSVLFAVNRAGSKALKSTDGGVTWNVLTPTAVNYVAVSPNFQNDHTLILGGPYGGYKSIDGGSTWNTLSAGNYVTNVAFSTNFAVDNTIFAGVLRKGMYKSVNGGATWVPINSGLTDLETGPIAVSPGYNLDQTLFVGAQNAGAFITHNGGSSWILASSGINNTNIRVMAVSPDVATDGKIFAGTYGDGIFRSVDSGETWQQIDNGLSNLDIEVLVTSPNFAQDNTVFASTPSELYKSIDQGANWTPAHTGILGTPGVNSLSFSPNFVADSTIFVNKVVTVYKSTNAGSSWSSVNNGLPSGIKSLLVSPDFALDQTLFATSSGRLYKSVDAGADWNLVNPALTTIYFEDIFISPAYGADQTLFAEMPSGLLKSTDGGFSWSVSTNALVNSYSVVFSSNYANDQTMFANLVAGEVMKSVDRGVNWTSSPPLPKGAYPYTMAISPNFVADGRIWAGSDCNGVFSYTFDHPPGIIQPALGLSKITAYWVSYSDYLSHVLTVDYRIDNHGQDFALNVRIAGSIATNGVIADSQILTLGDILPVSWLPFSVRYAIPAGISSFGSTTYATAQDESWNAYAYPGPYQGP